MVGVGNWEGIPMNTIQIALARGRPIRHRDWPPFHYAKLAKAAGPESMHPAQWPWSGRIECASMYGSSDFRLIITQ